MNTFSGLGLIIGLLIGSLANALAQRSLTNTTFLGRSYCPHCRKQLRWYDLLPVFSFVFLKGKCRYCQKKIPLEYLLTEVSMGVLISYLLTITLPIDLLNNFTFASILPISEAILGIFIIFVMVTTLITDLKQGIIPDRITQPSTIIVLIFLCLITVVKIILIYLSIINSALGKYLLPPMSDYFYRHALYAAEPLIWGVVSAIGIGLFFMALILVTRGRGMGGGDLKLGIFIGLVLGFPNAVVALMLSFLVGSIAGVGLLLTGKRKLGQTIPFGPFLSIGTIAALFWGEAIMKWYFNFKL